MKFIHEPDGADEPTIWVLEGGDTDQYQYTHLFSRVDLDPDARKFWPDVVARMTGTTITTDDATVTLLSQVIWAHEWFLPWPIDLDDNQRAESKVYEPTAKALLDALTGVSRDTDA